MAAPAPTGCFKCGRPGHWSKDCPSSSSSSTPSSNPNPKFPFTSKSSSTTPPLEKKPIAKKEPRTRPKLTPDLLLSDDGLGYVLRHFPKSFKYHGRGHEASDLGSLIGLYAEWHSRLLPYYSFEQFVEKVEQVGATKRVRRCVSELRERVSRGGDPTKLHEAPVEEVAPTTEQEGTDAAEQNVDTVDAPLEDHAPDMMQEDLFDEIYQNATHESPRSKSASELNAANRNVVGTSSEMEVRDSVNELNEIQVTEERSSDQVEAGNSASKPSKVQITEEQKARMEANRQKALERAAARARAAELI